MACIEYKKFALTPQEYISAREELGVSCQDVALLDEAREALVRQGPRFRFNLLPKE